MNYRRRTLVLILLLAALHLPILVPGFVAPYDYAQQNRELPFSVVLRTYKTVFP